ncbi:MAG: VTT domain-containing protein [Acidobacteriota bacterium]|jgi:phosphatidylserine/phosphatidylglycerophosphate/cardiolipin synthase-like enzyme/uncharacterized membrane protein YdjX (TVP38/TMEM64 family)
MMKTPILKEGRNCWRCTRAERLAFLVDGDAYFSRLADALETARRAILMLGWDFHSRVRLRRDADEASEFARILDGAVRKNGELHAHLLAWDYNVLFAPEREALPSYHFGSRTHRRIRFELDDCHPVGASHHQKVVVIDDALGFVGGFDITQARWDTPEHAPDETRRITPGGHRYRPFHDVHAAVSGPVARALGDLTRDRWLRATGEELQPVDLDSSPWPEDLVPELHDVDVAIARTDPAHEGRPEVQEIERLLLDAIAGAERWIYLENQYISSSSVRDALAARLREPSGPEILLVGPFRAAGWLEESTMGVLRARLLRTLREADKEGRLLACYPHVPGLGDDWLNVHSKVAVIDDRLLTVGSANLSNRSMGLDTECNLVVEVGDDPGRLVVAGLRDRLLGEHLGVPVDDVRRRMEQGGSLLRTVRDLGRGERRLEPMEESEPDWAEHLVADSAVVDPERPMDPEALLPHLGREGTGGRPGWKRWAIGGLMLGALVALAAVWRWGPAAEALSPPAIADRLDGWGSDPLAPLLAVAAFVTGSFLMVPVTAMILATALVFGPMTGLVVALGGSLAGAMATFEVGRRLGRQRVRRLIGGRMNRVVRSLQRRGMLWMAVVRLLPVAPFTVVNVVAGAMAVPRRAFALGTLLGMAPGIAAVTLLGESARRALIQPGPATLGVLVGAVVLVLGALALVRRFGTRHRDRGQ